MTDAQRVARLVRMDQCGGMPRDQLWRRTGLRADEFKTALMIAYKRKWIDFVRDYVVSRPG